MDEKCPASLLFENQCCGLKMCNLRFVVLCWIRWTSWVFENTVHRCICKSIVWVMLRRPIGSYLMWTLIITSMILLSKWPLLSSALHFSFHTHTLSLKDIKLKIVYKHLHLYLPNKCSLTKRHPFFTWEWGVLKTWEPRNKLGPSKQMFLIPYGGGVFDMPVIFTHD